MGKKHFCRRTAGTYHVAFQAVLFQPFPSFFWDSSPVVPPKLTQLPLQAVLFRPFPSFFMDNATVAPLAPTQFPTQAVLCHYVVIYLQTKTGAAISDCSRVLFLNIYSCKSLRSSLRSSLLSTLRSSLCSSLLSTLRSSLFSSLPSSFLLRP